MYRRIEISRYIALVASAAAMVYALFAGLRTVSDADLGWQLATGRWIIQHKAIPSTDILSYTAHGQEWIYPAASQVILYCSYLLGGYSLLSWLSALACVGTVALLLRGHPISMFLALIAVPLVAARTPPRAEMFTEVLFAAFLVTLWNYHRSGRGPLWLLPLLMGLWVNLHLGFTAGLAMCIAYVFMELEDVFPADSRANALTRLRRASPWLLATVLATLINPWGPRIYLALTRQNAILRIHSKWIAEWMSIPVASSTLLRALSWRDPESAIWWLLAAALLAMIVAAYQRRMVPALILGASVFLVLRSNRFAGPFVPVAVVIGGSILGDALHTIWTGRACERIRMKGKFLQVCTFACAVILVGFAGVRVLDLMSNRYYLRTAQASSFGSGESWWYPEESVSFIERERPTGNIFNGYDFGGFLVWQLSPAYPDFIDGRAVPFGGKLFFRSIELLQTPLDSGKWQREADLRNINTVVLSLDHSGGGLPISIDGFCRSQQWQPVHIDTRAAVFVRRRPETADLLNRNRVDCATIQFDAPPPEPGTRGEAARFNYHLNAAAILVALERYSEAKNHLRMAEEIFTESSDLHSIKGFVALNTGNAADAVQEFRKSLDIEPFDETARALAIAYRKQGRLPEAAKVLAQAAKISVMPYPFYLELGFVQLDMGLPNQALISFTQSEEKSPFADEAVVVGEGFSAQLAEGYQRAWSRVAAQDEARGRNPEARLATQCADSAAAEETWWKMADNYETSGLEADADTARRQANLAAAARRAKGITN